MNKLNKWDLVDIQMAETSKLELAQEYADREMENLKALDAGVADSGDYSKV